MIQFTVIINLWKKKETELKTLTLTCVLQKGPQIIKENAPFPVP